MNFGRGGVTHGGGKVAWGRVFGRGGHVLLKASGAMVNMRVGWGFEPRIRGGEDDLKMLRVGTGLTTGLALGVQVGTNTPGSVVFGEKSAGLSMGFGCDLGIELFRGEEWVLFWSVGFGVTFGLVEVLSVVGFGIEGLL